MSVVEETVTEEPRRLPTWDQLAVKLAQVGQEKSEWAGVPLPIPDYKLVIEPRYPYRLHIDTKDTINECPDYDEVVNSWYNRAYQGTVHVVRTERGRARCAVLPENRVAKMLGTFAVSAVWPMEAEFKAMDKLSQLVESHKLRYYMLTEGFLESSKRSKVSYWFRKSRPTLALRPSKDGSGMSVIAGLCLHPIGYYAGTWAGVMCPTDEVIAHLMMMRGDEHKFWAHANQHPAWHPASGL